MALISSTIDSSNLQRLIEFNKYFKFENSVKLFHKDQKRCQSNIFKIAYILSKFCSIGQN